MQLFKISRSETNLLFLLCKIEKSNPAVFLAGISFANVSEDMLHQLSHLAKIQQNFMSDTKCALSNNISPFELI